MRALFASSRAFASAAGYVRSGVPMRLTRYQWDQLTAEPATSLMAVDIQNAGHQNLVLSEACWHLAVCCMATMSAYRAAVQESRIAGFVLMPCVIANSHPIRNFHGVRNS